MTKSLPPALDSLDARLREQVLEAANIRLALDIQSRRVANLASARITTQPDSPPAQLRCPGCTLPLVYRETVISGVGRRRADRWDRFACRACGSFEYRHRTRRLRP